MAEEKKTFKKGLSGLVKDKGSRNFLIVIGLIILGSLSYFFFFTNSQTEQPTTGLSSSINANISGQDTQYTGGTGNERYQELLEKKSDETIENAINTGGSAIRPPRAAAGSEEIVLPQEPYLPTEGEVIATIGEPKTQEEREIEKKEEAKVVENKKPVYNQAVKDRMVQLFNQSITYETNSISQNPVIQNFYTPVEDNNTVVASNDNSSNENQNSNNMDENKIELPLPGTVVYAETVSEANSDAPGPILIRILQGKFTGATVIASFETAQDALIITGNTMTIRDPYDPDKGQSVRINTVAVDTKYLGTALATDVDKYIGQRLAVAFTKGLFTGLSDAISQSGSTSVESSSGTTTTSNPDLNATEKGFLALGNVADETSSVLEEEYGRRQPTIKVKAGTPIGLLFLE